MAEPLFPQVEPLSLALFSPGSTKNRYLGIWYKKISIKTVVWVANRLNTGSTKILLELICVPNPEPEQGLSKPSSAREPEHKLS